LLTHRQTDTQSLAKT